MGLGLELRTHASISVVGSDVLTCSPISRTPQHPAAGNSCAFYKSTLKAYGRCSKPRVSSVDLEEKQNERASRSLNAARTWGNHSQLHMSKNSGERRECMADHRGLSVLAAAAADDDTALVPEPYPGRDRQRSGSPEMASAVCAPSPKRANFFQDDHAPALDRAARSSHASASLRADSGSRANRAPPIYMLTWTEEAIVEAELLQER